MEYIVLLAINRNLFSKGLITKDNMIPELRTSEKPSIFNGFGVSQDLLNITPELHTVFYRRLRSFPGHKMPIEYIYSLAI